MRKISIAQLFEDHRERLALEWVAALGSERFIDLKRRGNNYGADLVGHLNVIHPERLQVIGFAEQAWLTKANPERLKNQMQDMFAAEPPAVIVAEGLEVLAMMKPWPQISSLISTITWKGWGSLAPKERPVD